jgi:RNA polymerase sigma-70 factor (ECF subfamily)
VSSDSELIRRSIRHDHAAFAELFDRHGKALFRYAFALTHDADDAQDLVQETFMTAWRRLADIHLVGDSMLPWLIVACRNHGANLQRSKAVRASAPIEDADGAGAGDGTLDRLQHAEELAWIQQAIDGLGETDRRIAELCLHEGLDYRAAAAQLGLSVSVITKRIHRTRTRLREERSLRDREAST